MTLLLYAVSNIRRLRIRFRELQRDDQRGKILALDMLHPANPGRNRCAKVGFVGFFPPVTETGVYGSKILQNTIEALKILGGCAVENSPASAALCMTSSIFGVEQLSLYSCGVFECVAVRLPAD